MNDQNENEPNEEFEPGGFEGEEVSGEDLLLGNSGVKEVEEEALTEIKEEKGKPKKKKSKRITFASRIGEDHSFQFTRIYQQLKLLEVVKEKADLLELMVDLARKHYTKKHSIQVEKNKKEMIKKMGISS